MIVLESLEKVLNFGSKNLYKRCLKKLKLGVRNAADFQSFVDVCGYLTTYPFPKSQFCPNWDVSVKLTYGREVLTYPESLIYFKRLASEQWILKPQAYLFSPIL